MTLTMSKKVFLPDNYFDDTDLENLYSIPVVLENPTYRQRKEIELFKTLYRGVMLVTGKPRSGKDLFGVTFSKLNKVYFGRPVLLDFKPKRLFGEYIPFDPVLMVRQINNMAKQAKFKSDDTEEAMSNDEENYFKSMTEEWLNTNEVLFKNAILYLSELKRYCYNRNPHSRMNKFIGSLCTIYGHLDLLILGTHVQAHEIDQYSFLYYITHWAKCKWSLVRPHTTDVRISRGTYLTELGQFDVALKPIVYHVDGAAPRSWLGGARCYDLYNTQNLVNLKPVMQKETAG